MLQSLPIEPALTPAPIGGADVSGVGIHELRAAGDPGIAYYLHRPLRPNPHLPVLVAVHGIQRQAREQARLFAPLVETLGGTLVAPFFDRHHFRDYQRLGRLGKKGNRADRALRRILADVTETTGLQTRHVVLFGYSGGGQFAHRFAMAYPRQVLRLAVAAPGWFTFPDPDRRFPEGVGPSAALPDLVFDPARFLEIPTLVLVGDRDTERDEALNRSGRLDAHQGRNRVERGQRWVEAMTAEAARYNCPTPYVFDTLAGCGHSFVDCMSASDMGARVIRFLYPDGAATASDASASAPPGDNASDKRGGPE